MNSTRVGGVWLQKGLRSLCLTFALSSAAASQVVRPSTRFSASSRSMLPAVLCFSARLAGLALSAVKRPVPKRPGPWNDHGAFLAELGASTASPLPRLSSFARSASGLHSGTAATRRSAAEVRQVEIPVVAEGNQR